MIIHFGVVDVAYSEDGKSETTFEVAKKLEAEYGVMRIFITAHEHEIADEMSEELMAMLDGPVRPANVHFTEVDAKFRDYLNKGEWEKITGRQTGAAADRKSARHKSGTKTADRPSFIDTGLYRRSFRSWVS
jgi:hypothetical protein